jgi:hypothetical protein
MSKKTNIARRFGYTFAGEAYALAVSLFEDGREKDAFMALRTSISAKDAKVLASELSSRNEVALVEAGLKKPEEEIEEEDDDSVLSSLEQISAYIEAAGDYDSVDDDEEAEDEDKYSEDEESIMDEDEEDDMDYEEGEDEDEDSDYEDESEDELEDEMFGDDEDEDEDENNEDEDDVEESEYDEPELEDDEEDLEIEDSLENFEAKAERINNRLAEKRELKRTKVAARAIINKASLGKRPKR